MTTPSEEYALLIAAATPVDAELAKSLLEEHGIPCLFHAQDRDFAELGELAHMTVSRPDVLVPKSALERAVAVLQATWENFQPPESS